MSSSKLLQTPSFKLAFIEKGDPKSDKLALVLPGRLDTKDYVHMTSHVDLLASLGFYAISFDPPFSWESPGDTARYTTTSYIKTVNEIIGFFENKSTLLIGHSRGGAVSSLVAANNEHVMAVVPIMATYGAASHPRPADIEAGFYATVRDLPPGDRRTDQQKSFRLPLTYFKDSEQYDPAEALRKITVPKLLIHGIHDEYTPIDRVEEVYQTIPEPKKLLELDCDHDYRYRPDVIAKINAATKEFIEENSL